jgi:glycerol uptake facilitator-like aquaporin
MKNPFTPRQIRRYLLLYAAVVLFMALFYFANTAMNPARQHEKKTFETTVPAKEKKEARPEEKSVKERPAIRLLDEAY